VREYNRSYNYFAGMSEEAVAKYQKDAITGHRPTWKMGLGKSAGFEARAIEIDDIVDPLGVFAHLGGFARNGAETARPGREARTVRNAERKALGKLGLETDASAADIKARFKALVKQHHPDANGGDRSSEDKLREIIQAYNYLKSVGFC
jgi:hypothetical protein